MRLTFWICSWLVAILMAVAADDHGGRRLENRSAKEDARLKRAIENHLPPLFPLTPIFNARMDEPEGDDYPQEEDKEVVDWPEASDGGEGDDDDDIDLSLPSLARPIFHMIIRVPVDENRTSFKTYEYYFPLNLDNEGSDEEN